MKLNGNTPQERELQHSFIGEKKSIIAMPDILEYQISVRVLEYVKLRGTMERNFFNDFIIFLQEGLN